VNVPSKEVPTKRPQLTVSEVVDRFEISRATLKRRLATGELTGANKDTTGTWRIPIESLHSAQIKAKKTWLTELAHEPIELAHELAQPEKALQIRVSELERELAHELAQRVMAERIAEERKERITDLQRAMAMLEATAPPAKKRRWWQASN